MEKQKNLIMTEEEVDELILEFINEAIDDSIKEISRVEGSSVSDVMENHRFSIKRALFVARRQL